MLTSAQVDAIREHVALDERINELIRLANHDLYCGPLHSAGLYDEDELEHVWPGFVTACHMIREALPAGDLYLDTEIDEVIGDTEPDECHFGIVRVDSRHVVRVLVGSELARYV